MTTFLPRHLSVSSIGLYAKCPAQWRQRYVDRIVLPDTAAQATGKAFHRALEAEHRGEDAALAWITAADQAGTELTMTKAHGLKLLSLYRSRGLGGQKGEPERKFVLPFPSPNIPVPLLGFMDLPVPEERHYRDFKTTSGTYWTQAKVDVDPQKDAYGWAYQRLYRHRPERALWLVFNTQQATIDEYETVPSPEGFRVFEQTAELVWAGIVAGRFDGCGACTLCKPQEEKSGDGPAFVWA